MNNYIYEYYQKIRSGEIVVGKWISMLYEKIITGMESGDYRFDQYKSNIVRSTTATTSLRNYNGSLA